MDVKNRYQAMMGNSQWQPPAASHYNTRWKSWWRSLPGAGMELTLETYDAPTHLPVFPCPQNYWQLCHIPETRFQQFHKKFNMGNHVSTQISSLLDCKTGLDAAWPLLASTEVRPDLQNTQLWNSTNKIGFSKIELKFWLSLRLYYLQQNVAILKEPTAVYSTSE